MCVCVVRARIMAVARKSSSAGGRSYEQDKKTTPQQNQICFVSPSSTFECCELTGVTSLLPIAHTHAHTHTPRFDVNPCYHTVLISSIQPNPDPKPAHGPQLSGFPVPF